MSTRTIVYDLNRTLADTAPDLIGSLNVLFVREGLAPISIEERRRIMAAASSG